MTEESSNRDEPEPVPKRIWWFQRPTIRTLKVQAERRVAEFHKDLDRRDNDETRLPPTEEVHLGGLVLVEAFTPSTVSGLSQALTNLPMQEDRRERLLASIARSRRSGSGGMYNLSIFRPGIGLVDSESYHDPELPEGVDAAWLQFNGTVQSLTMIVATFTFSEEAGNLSTLMRQDYQTKLQNLRVRVFGRAARLRQRIPWARPRIHGESYSLSLPSFEKNRACADAIHHHQDACERWFYKRFPGRFSLADKDHRPIMHLLFTTEQAPFTEDTKWLQPVGLDRSFDLWRSPDDGFPGWFLSLSSWPRNKKRHTVTLAARRRDAGKEMNGEQNGQTNWHLTQQFAGSQASLAARYAMVALLTIYSDELSRLRDRAGSRRRPQRTVREAKTLDRYLIGDGLDAATITSDIRALTEDFTRFRWGVPEYSEVVENHRSDKVSSANPADNLLERAKRLRDYIKERTTPQGDHQIKKTEVQSLTVSLCERLNEQATRLADDTAATTENIRASAELRQAMANTRLQRTVLVLSIIAIIVSIATALAT